MSRKKRFIKDLTEEDLQLLERTRKTGKNYQIRDRSHCIILSFLGFEIKDLAFLFSVGKNTISIWFNSWEKEGFEGLKNTPGQGRKPKISIDNKEQVIVVEMAAKNAANHGTNMLDEVVEKLDLEQGPSQSTLNRFLKKKSMLGKGFVIARKKVHQSKSTTTS